MATLKELSKKSLGGNLELSDILEKSKETDNEFVRYMMKDAKIALHMHRDFLYSDIQERLNKRIEEAVIKAIKCRVTDRFVTLGGTKEYPMVIIDMLTKEYNVLYGFGEERRAYNLALQKQGYKCNFNLYMPTNRDTNMLASYNVRFDMGILFKQML